MKKVVFSSNSSFYLLNFKIGTLKYLIEKGYKVICISPKDKYSMKLKDIGCVHENIDISSQSKNPFKDLKVFLSFFLIYKRLRPNICFHFTVKPNIYGTLAAAILGVKIINNITGLGTTFIHKNITSYIVKILYSISQPLAFKVLCQNNDDYKVLLKLGFVKQNQLLLVPGSGVNITKFVPCNKINNKEHIYTFMYIGRMLADKGLRELISAMKKLNYEKIICKLYLYGPDESDNVSSISIDELKHWNSIPGVLYKGITETPHLVLQHADCVVLPSYREGMPRSLLEAGAMGLPSVATNVPGCKHIIQHKFNGVLCDPRSIESLEQAMRLMINIPEDDQREMGHKARERVVREFNEQKLIDLTLEFVQEAKT